jgi:hypothetical protein
MQESQRVTDAYVHAVLRRTSERLQLGRRRIEVRTAIQIHRPAEAA